MAAEAQPSRFVLGTGETQYGVRVKLPKLIAGPVELGLAASVEWQETADGQRVPTFHPRLSVKDVVLRGKFEADLKEGKLSYSKKLRLPFLNTELLKLRLTTQWPTEATTGGAGVGVLSRVLGLSFSFVPDRLHVRSIVRKAPDYSIQIAPRVGAPQVVYDKLRVPGSIYLKANTTLHLSDAPALRDVRAHLDVHNVRAVVRLYDASRTKPCRLFRNITHAARRLSLEDAEVEEEAAEDRKEARAAAEVVRVLEEETPQPSPDPIDRVAAKAREWSHAILVNSCVATEHLRDEAALAGQRLKSLLPSGVPSGDSGSDAAAPAAAPAAPKAAEGKGRGKGKKEA